MNWIEKAVEEIAEGYSNVGKLTIEILKKDLTHIITKYAPVMDAEALAKKIDNQYEQWGQSEWEYFPGEKEAIKEIAQLITSSIDLNITWKDGKAEWGDFRLRTDNQESFTANYYWIVEILSEEEGKWVVWKMSEAEFPTQALAIKACEQALRSIVCGVKG